MSTIHRITNPNKKIEEKVNYFLDQITHATSYIGWQWSLELENPIALLEKIIFRLKHDNDFRLTYFDNHFKHSFFTTETFWERYRNFADIKVAITRYNALTNNQKAEKIQLLSNVTFRRNLELLHRDLQHKMFRDIMDAVFSHVQCPHKLDDPVPGVTETHAYAIKSAAYALVAAYVFKGYTRNEIRQIISRVFSKDEHEFPFPKHVKTKTQRKKHLAEKELKNQLHGFTNAYEEASGEGKVIVKVFGAEFPEKFQFRYNNVFFYGKDHAYIRRIKEKMKSEDRDDFFGEGNYILAAADVHWHSSYSLLENIAQQVRSELTFLSAMLDRNFSVDTTSNYIRLSAGGRYQGMAWSSRKFDNAISERALEQLNDNAYHDLRKYKGTAVDWFLSHEPLFVQAHMSNSIADYWLYIEVLLSYNQVEKKVMNLVSTIILSNEKWMQDKRILTTIRNAFLPLSGGFYLLNAPKLNTGIQKAKPAVKAGKITAAVRNVKYPFISELVKEFDTALGKAYYQKAHAYYNGILKEAYEYRNFAIHGGKGTQAAKTKMLATLPNIVVRLRWAILKTIKKGEQDTPFDLLIEKMVKAGDQLLTT